MTLTLSFKGNSEMELQSHSDRSNVLTMRNIFIFGDPPSQIPTVGWVIPSSHFRTPAFIFSVLPLYVKIL